MSFKKLFEKESHKINYTTLKQYDQLTQTDCQIENFAPATPVRIKRW